MRNGRLNGSAGKSAAAEGGAPETQHTAAGQRSSAVGCVINILFLSDRAETSILYGTWSRRVGICRKNCKGIHGEWPPRLQSPDANPPPGVAVTNSRIPVADTLTPPWWLSKELK